MTTLVQEWRKARSSAETKIDRLTQEQKKRQEQVWERTQKRPLKKGLQDGQAREAAEYVRTVSLVAWMAAHSTERDQIDALATEIRKLGSQALVKFQKHNPDGARTRYKNRLGDHLWCDCIAAIVVGLQEVGDLHAKIDDALKKSAGADTNALPRPLRARAGGGRIAGVR